MDYWIGYKLILENIVGIVPLLDRCDDGVTFLYWQPACCLFVVMINYYLLGEVHEEMVHINCNTNRLAFYIEYVVHLSNLD